ncbi:MAG: energy-coupling factor transporter transmembrane protein EcfT [Bryobacterales bacterium]|nr:energy-coupling factor transporter transmembrane protein EcfT [Bryobacterales bacterium]
MTLSLIDTHAHLDSPLHRLDPRAKIGACFLALLAVASAPRGAIAGYWAYYAILGVLLLLSRVPLRYFASRCLLASPFVVMAAALPLLAAPGPASLPVSASLLLRAFAAVLLLALLTATCRFHHLLWGLRRLRAPEVLTTVTGLMVRYIDLLVEEWQRAERARESRLCGPPRSGTVRLHARQVALVFLRSWERADRVYAAMLARGFSGEMPLWGRRVFRGTDAFYVAAVAGAFATVRWTQGL